MEQPRYSFMTVRIHWYKVNQKALFHESIRPTLVYIEDLFITHITLKNIGLQVGSSIV